MNAPRLPAALVVGVDRPASLAVVRELGRRGVPVHGVGRDMNAVGRTSRYLQRFALRPAGPVTGWLPELMAAWGSEVALGIGEEDLLALKAAGGSVPGCRILTPPWDALALVLDKRRTLDLAGSLGIEVPQTWQPRTPEEPAPDLGWPVVVKWPNPAVVKPALAAAGLAFAKTEYAADEAALRALLTRYAPVGSLPIVQRRVPGRGLGHMLYMHQGKAVLRFQHERLHEWPAEGGVSTLCRALPPARDAAQMERSEALLAAIGWEGPAMVEYRRDPAAGRFVLMEVNGRFWGSQPLATASGAEFGWELYRRQVLGENSLAPAPRTNLRARHMMRETKRLARLLSRRRAPADPAYAATPWRDLARYLLGFIDPRTRYYVLTLDDPRPFLAGMAADAARLTAKLRRPRLDA
ncbi:MAG TPA: carboxylate--amine ligase [Allosphingosinicella sp.]|nr:carboxylate--amine ligase [Allosphingosinicella sp.]